MLFSSVLYFGLVAAAASSSIQGGGSSYGGRGGGKGSGHHHGTCPPIRNDTVGLLGQCPQDFDVIGPGLEAVHESATAPTGLAVDRAHNIYLTYPRNSGLTPVNVAIATGFRAETPWPDAAIQNCSAGQDPSTCFINVQNVVLDSRDVMWAVDSGIPPGAKQAVPGGAKIMGFNVSTRRLIRSYPCPTPLLANGMNANDVRVNVSVGVAGTAYITDESPESSILAVDLDSGAWIRRLFNTSVVRANPGYVGVYDGRPYYSWKGTNKSSVATGADGLTLASGQVFWSVFASHRWYYLDQHIMANASATDQEVLDAVVFPGECGTEQAGLTADDRGRVYITASEQNAIFYADTLQSEVKEEVNGVGPGGSGLTKPENYVIKTLVRNAQIQHADSAAILDGWLYFCTNQLLLAPQFQYNNTDKRRAPFRSFRTWIGRGPAV